jgi:hypothetical protein
MSIKPSTTQLCIMRQRQILLSDIRSNLQYLRQGGNPYHDETSVIEGRIEFNQQALHELPEVEVIVEVVLYQDNMATDSIRIVTTSDRYIETAIVRACALKPYWAREVQDSFAEVTAHVVDVIQIRSESDLNYNLTNRPIKA